MSRGVDTVTVPEPTRTSFGSNGSRALPKRRSLPNGRAALGGLLVAAAVVVLFAVADARRASPMERYVVAARTLGIGSRITAADLRSAEMHVPAGALRQRVFNDTKRLIGTTVIAPVADGELIQASVVVEGADLRQISVPIEAARSLGDRLQPGELVDVLATFGTGGEAFTVGVVRAARVVGRETSGGTLGDRKNQLVVLAVDNGDDAMAIAHAVAAGQVTLVRVTGEPTSGSAQSDPTPYRAPRPSGGR